MQQSAYRLQSIDSAESAYAVFPGEQMLHSVHIPRQALCVLFGASVFAGAVACSSEAPTSATAQRAITPTGGPNFFTSEDPSTKSLWTRVVGPTKITEAGDVTYRAAVSGGVGPYRYDWHQQYCYPNSTCSESYLIRSTWEVDTIQVYFPSEMHRFRFIVHVRDSQAEPHAGVATRTTVNMIYNESGGSEFSCNLEQDYYPIADWPPNPEHHPDSTTYYRRNGCTGEREYGPGPWDPPEP